VSLSNEEAERVAQFLAPPPGRRAILDQLRGSLHL
jgi:hypothetical protein